MSDPVPATSPDVAQDKATDPTQSANEANGAPNANGEQTLTLRALVSTKDAGIIIGKGGKTVDYLRSEMHVNAGVSKLITGVHERVLSVSGTVANVSKAYTFILHQLVTSIPTSGIAPAAPSNHTTIRLLISHNLMGTIIGRGGVKIKTIQDASGARMVAQKDMLPQSTERIVEVQGVPDAIGAAIEEIGKCLLEDWERGVGTVLYHPGTHGAEVPPSLGGLSNRRASAPGLSNFSSIPSSQGFADHGRRLSMINENTASAGRSAPLGTTATSGSAGAGSRSLSASHSNGSSAVPPNAASQTQTISIPADMVGCIIGKQGSKITEIRRLSGCQISIAKAPHDETGERKFTIIGSPEEREKALYLLYNQLESEKERRVARDAGPGNGAGVEGITNGLGSVDLGRNGSA